MIQLYGHPHRVAVNILKVRAALYEVGAEHTYVPVDLAKGEQRRPEFLVLNPHGKVPVLVDDGVAIAESNAILWYVGEKFAAARLVPRETPARARVLQWCEFALTALYMPNYDFHTHTAGAEPGQRSAFVAERSRAAVDRSLNVLESVLASSEYVAGTVSIADFAIMAGVHGVQTRGPWDAEKYPRTAAFANRFGARPSWKRALAAE